MKPLLVKGFRVFRPQVNFRHFLRFAPYLLLKLWEQQESKTMIPKNYPKFPTNGRKITSKFWKTWKISRFYREGTI